MARALRERGQIRVYGVADARVSVVSTPQATVWCGGGMLWWRDALGRRVQILAAEIETAVGLLLEQAQAQAAPA
ncbi:hypothetical protein [Streptomonospora salina]|uniref:Uncharacterized protein n=1 Tax=Streptomonospora salina TaxID=104205 RepID=A0A841EGA3_9ACTN|nr:hypothetical protein [Streptomonospora salina]MBB6000063.1 hypothetical protein [Streptomonospora salina]